MDISALRPVLSGLIGAAIALWALRKLSKWIPTTCGGRPISEVAYKHRSIFECPDAIREAFVAYAVGQDTPPALLNGIMAAGIILLFVTVGSMYRS
jgi:hypothetical protein